MAASSSLPTGSGAQKTHGGCLSQLLSLRQEKERKGSCPVKAKLTPRLWPSKMVTMEVSHETVQYCRSEVAFLGTG